MSDMNITALLFVKGAREGRPQRAIEALAGQTRPLFEIIIVDTSAHSIAGGAARAAKAGYVHLPGEDRGTALNRGTAQASGEVVFIVDETLVPDLDAAAKAAVYFRRPEVAALGGVVRFEGGRSVWPGLATAEYEYDRRRQPAPIRGVDPGFAFFKKTAMEDVGGFDPGGDDCLGPDLGLGRRLVEEKWRLVIEPEVTARLGRPVKLWPYLDRQRRTGRGDMRNLMAGQPALGRRGEVIEAPVLAFGLACFFGVVFKQPSLGLAVLGLSMAVVYGLSLGRLAHLVQSGRRLWPWLMVLPRALARTAGMAEVLCERLTRPRTGPSARPRYPGDGRGPM